MRISTTQPLFAWDELEDSPTLKTLKQFLEVIPDENRAPKPTLSRDEG